MNKNYLALIMFVAVCFFQIGCKKTPKCEVFYCEDEYNDLDSVSKNFFYNIDTSLVLNFPKFTNGIDTLNWINLNQNKQIDNVENCPSECYDTSTKYHSFIETVYSNIQDGSYYPNSVGVTIKNDSSFVSTVTVTEGHYINFFPGNYPEAEFEKTEVVFPFSSIGNYYIGNYSIYSMSYTDIYKVTLNGVNLYFNRNLGILNSYNAPDYFKIP